MNILYNHKTEKSFTERFILPFLVIYIVIIFIILCIMIIFGEIGETIIHKIIFTSFFSMMATLCLIGLLLIDNFILYDSIFTPPYRLLSVIKRNQQLKYTNIVEIVKTETCIRVTMSDENVYLYGFSKIKGTEKTLIGNREKVWKIFKDRINDDCVIIEKYKDSVNRTRLE